ncbi:glycosyltransferase family 2 protein [Haliovirga abyssi]|uniref:Glycosyl transferase family 2 n=1 Tax=Haliovirga abyssi TaxID=2996794 RepID=A0AAU9D500_9FUSO|nr:glycosyltransferase family 2 protein [Haliovirga abyssi]BDU51131.1 glycosyl transferase family 2 [Haliovirga abyssi]
MGELLILIPAYNEEKHIEKVIKKISTVLKEIDIKSKIVVVNDGSKDNTEEIAKSAGAEVINHVFNMGYGAALQTGYKYAFKNEYKYVIQLDSDGQHEPENIKNIYEALKNGEGDLILGSRFLENRSNYNPTLFRKIGMGLFSWVTSTIIGKKITDITTGYQGLNRKVLKVFIQDIYPTDYPDADVLIMLYKKRLKINEVPVLMYELSNKESMHSGIIGPLYYVFKMFLSILVMLIRKL